MARNYKDIDVAALTIDDALQDSDWGKHPWDYVAFVAIDAGVLEGFADFTDAELAETMRALAAYCVTGTQPDYSNMSTTVVKIAVRTMIRAHDARINAEYLKHYKQYVAAVKRKQG